MLNKKLYYTLSLTWGLPLTLVGGIVSLFLILMGYKPKRFGWSYYFEVGNNWGGVNLGLIFLCSENSSNQTQAHEFGHSIQNCYFGFLMPLIVAIPSAVRYWYREWQYRHGNNNLPDYDAIWFEGQATQLGLKYIDKIEEN